MISNPKKIFSCRSEELDYTMDQKKALLLVSAFMESDDYHFLLAGNAGTGKTTIAENIANFSNAQLIAPTNAAVQRLKDKFESKKIDKSRFSTIHQLLYGYPDPVTGEFVPRKGMLPRTTYIIDEASMIDSTLLNDLIEAAVKTKNKLIFIGDDFQLEPIGQDPKLFEWEKSNPLFKEQWKIKLKDVRRTEGNILTVATHVRENECMEIPNIDNHDFKVVNLFTEDIALDIRDDADYVVLVSTNKTRMNYNTHIRRSKYNEDSKHPVLNGERVISVSNQTFLNGEQYIIKNPTILTQYREEINVGSRNNPILQTYDMYLVDHEVVGYEGSFKTLLVPNLDKPSLYPGMIMSNWNLNTDTDLTKYNKMSRKSMWHSHINIATYGYAISVHKSQGNEWDNVYIDCDWLSPAWNKPRWLYTALTRAKKKIELKKSKEFKFLND